MFKAISCSAKKAWRGQERLWVAFWGWFVVPNVAEGIINHLFHFNPSSFLASIFPQTITGLNISITIYLTLLIPFIAFWSIVIWKCAKNSEKKIWFYAARVFVCIQAFVFTYRIIELALVVAKWNVHN